MLIERAEDIAVVRQALADARDQQRGALVAVSGPFGSGRTALLAEVAAQIPTTDETPATVVLRAGGARSEGNLPFGVTRRLLHGLQPDSAPPPGGTEESEARRLRDLLRDQAEAGPVLLLWDDLRWSDPASLHWLELLTERLADTALVVVAVTPHATDPEADRPRLRTVLARTTHRVRLRPLSPAGATALAEDRVQDRALLPVCVDLAGGNPLFLTALAEQVRRIRQPLAPCDLTGLRPAPIGTHAVRALDELPPAARHLAGALAVVGPPADRELLLRLTRLTEAEGTEALAALVSTGLITGGDVLGFSHDAIDEAVAESLDAATEAQLHARAARAFQEAGRPSAEVARHILAAGGPTAGWEIGVLRNAARTELALGNPALARKYLLQALVGCRQTPGTRAEQRTAAEHPWRDAPAPDPVPGPRPVPPAPAAHDPNPALTGHPAPADLPGGPDLTVPPDLTAVPGPAVPGPAVVGPAAGSGGPAGRAVQGEPEHAELLADLARVEYYTAPVSSIRHLIQASAGLPGAVQRACELAHVPALICENPPDGLADALAACLAGLGDPARLPPEHRDTARALESWLALANLGHPRRFAETVRRFRTTEAPTTTPTGAARDRIAVLAHAGMLAGQDSEAVIALARTVLATPPTADDLYSAAPLAARALLAADQHEAAESWIVGLHAAARGGEAEPGNTDRLVADAEYAYLLARRGRHSEAARLAAGVLEYADPEFVPATGRACEALAWVLTTNNPAPAGRTALARFRDRDDAFFAPWLGHVVDAALASYAGDACTALDHVLEAGRERELIGWHNPALMPWRSWAAWLQHRIGRPDLAQQLAAQEYEQARAWGTRASLGRALRMRAAVTPGRQGIALAEQATAVLEGSGDHMELARAHLLLGRLLFTTDRSSAVHHLARNEQLAGGTRLPQQTGRNRPARPAPAPTPVRKAVTLTPGERRIASLAVAGQGNQRIATELGISLRAVEKHLTRVYRKLGVVGRAQLTESALLGGHPEEGRPAPVRGARERAGERAPGVGRTSPPAQRTDSGTAAAGY